MDEPEPSTSGREVGPGCAYYCARSTLAMCSAFFAFRIGWLTAFSMAWASACSYHGTLSSLLRISLLPNTQYDSFITLT